MRKVAEDGRPRSTKNVYIYKSGDERVDGVRLAVNARKYPTIDSLLDELTDKIPGLNFGARKLATPHGKHTISSLDQLQHLGSYVCAGQRRRRVPGVNLDTVKGPNDFKFRGSFYSKPNGPPLKIMGLNYERIEFDSLVNGNSTKSTSLKTDSDVPVKKKAKGKVKSVVSVGTQTKKLRTVKKAQKRETLSAVVQTSLEKNDATADETPLTPEETETILEQAFELDKTADIDESLHAVEDVALSPSAQSEEKPSEKDVQTLADPAEAPHHDSSNAQPDEEPTLYEAFAKSTIVENVAKPRKESGIPVKKRKPKLKRSKATGALGSNRKSESSSAEDHKKIKKNGVSSGKDLSPLDNDRLKHVQRSRVLNGKGKHSSLETEPSKPNSPQSEALAQATKDLPVDEAAAAVQIQSVYRGYKARKELQTVKQNVTQRFDYDASDSSDSEEVAESNGQANRGVVSTQAEMHEVSKTAAIDLMSFGSDFSHISEVIEH